MRLLEVARAYKAGKATLDDVKKAWEALPERERAEAGSPEWFDGQVSPRDDLLTAGARRYLTASEAETVTGQKSEALEWLEGGGE